MLQSKLPTNLVGDGKINKRLSDLVHHTNAIDDGQNSCCGIYGNLKLYFSVVFKHTAAYMYK